MKQTLILTGDINLLNVSDPKVPFRHVAARLNQADIVFSNLECCFYEPPVARVLEERGVEGFYALLNSGLALKKAGIAVVGTANNQNYGSAAIKSSLARLDELGILHAGSGIDLASARKPAILEKNGVRFGFIQRTCHYWPRKHEAGSKTPGVAVLKAHTTYEPPLMIKPGLPPKVHTWMDPQSLAAFKDDIKALRDQSDVVVSAHHWGLGWQDTILDYQVEIAHAAIDAGADIVVGHGPHLPGGIEYYRGKPIFYSLCAFSFYKDNKKIYGDWFGEMATITLDGSRVEKVAFSPVRHNKQNETLLPDPSAETEVLARLTTLSRKLGTELRVENDEVLVLPL